jgi:alkylation response protein AidB-like acyl-CoA dehydrogenase
MAGGTMDFELTAEQQDLKKRIRDLVDKHILPRAAEVDKTSDIPWDIMKLMADAGLFKFLVPEQYGGSGKEDLRALELSLIREELSRGSYQADTIYALNGLGSYSIVHSGTEEQKKKFLPPIAEGKSLACMSLTEKDAGSDAANVNTTATFEGNEWVLNGEKIYASNASVASVIVVFATVDKSKGAHGITAFAVDPKEVELEFRPIQVLAPHDICEIIFKNVRIPKDSVVGEVGHGFRVAMKTLDVLRTSVGAAAIGLAQHALDLAVEWAQKRLQFGKPLAKFQLIQDKLADMVTEIHAGRLMVYYAAWLKDNGAPRVTLESSMAKWWCTEMAQRVVDKAVQIYGGYGVRMDYPMQRLYRAVRGPRLYEGTTEIQKLIVCRELLKHYEQEGHFYGAGQ